MEFTKVVTEEVTETFNQDVKLVIDDMVSLKIGDKWILSITPDGYLHKYYSAQVDGLQTDKDGRIKEDK